MSTLKLSRLLNDDREESYWNILEAFKHVSKDYFQNTDSKGFFEKFVNTVDNEIDITKIMETFACSEFLSGISNKSELLELPTDPTSMATVKSIICHPAEIEHGEVPFLKICESNETFKKSNQELFIKMQTSVDYTVKMLSDNPEILRELLRHRTWLPDAENETFSTITNEVDEDAMEAECDRQVDEIRASY